MKFKTKNDLISTSYFHVSVVLGLMILTIQSGCFDDINVDIGQEFYAEKTPDWMPQTWLPYLSMPLNAVVNIGYVVIGVYWLSRVTKNDYWVSVFCWMSILYGPVQLYRIVSQSTRSAVLDQWVTLPFFAWMYQWTCLKLDHKVKSQWFIVPVSIISFTLSLFTHNGFEIALAVHMLVVLCSSLFVLIQYSNGQAVKYYLLALVSSIGFVVLKLFDLEMGRFCPEVFTVLSGHFLSKICDFLQIHFCCLFVYSVENKLKLI